MGSTGPPKFGWLLFVGVVTTIASRLGVWLSGYHISLDTFSYRSLVDLAIGFTPVAICVYCLVKISRAKMDRARRIILGLAFAFLLLVALGFFLPNKLDGFRFRVETIGELELRSIAIRARALARERNDGSLPESTIRSDWNREYVDELAPQHLFLRLGDYPPRIEFSEEETTIYWGSGLIGTLGVVIFDQEVPEDYACNYCEQVYPGILITSF